MMYRIAPWIPALALLAAAPASADWRCDCTTITGSCNAKVTVQKNWVDVTSNTKQCSRVDYFIDGMPFVAVVTDGKLRQNWISRSQQAKVLIQSCQVCRDSAEQNGSSATATAAPAPGKSSSGKLQPLIRVEPNYPAKARERGQQGFVELAFDVDEQGIVNNARVTRSRPKGVFDTAALAALRRWRYPAQTGRKPVSLTTRIDFSLPSAAQRAAQARAAAASAAAPTGPRNECIHQDTAYNFGDMVEVGLINACGQPLVVYACAQGTGTYLNRWVCTDSEQQRQVLVSPTDKRTGTTTYVDTPNAAGNYRYADNFFLTRAPNTQYWWLACAPTDTDCRNDARAWTRSVDKQPASMDPQGRSSLNVARSL